MRAKDVEFDVTYIDLRNKPDWFLEISPHGKVPVLKVDDEILFESNAIAEYLDEVVPPRLHPEDPIKRARNRAWTDYIPTFSGAFGKVQYAKTKEEMEAGLEELPKVLAKLEEALENERDGDGPYFNGPELSLVDCAYAPTFMRFARIDKLLGTNILDGYPKVKAWAETLNADPVVRNSVPEDFDEAFEQNLHRRECYAATLLDGGSAAAAE